MLAVLDAARQWTEAGVSVTLLDAHRYLYYSGMVPEYLGGVYAQDEVRIDLQRLCAEQGVTFHEDPATAVDPERRVVVTRSGARHAFDLVAFDIGAQNPAAQPNTIATKPLFHIEQLEARLRTALTTGEAFDLVIAGGGAAGVEVALNVSARFAAEGASDQLRTTIVEQQPALMSSFPRGLQSHVTETLQQRGVRLARSATVERVEEDVVHLADGRALPADAVLWATGSSGPSLFRNANLPTDPRGFLSVTSELQCAPFPRIFAAGDCATVAGHASLRKVGVHAIKQGPTLRDNLDAALHGLRAGSPSSTWTLTPFRPYPIAPLILSTGTADGLWTAGPVWLRGKPFLRLKHFIDRRWIRAYTPTVRASTLHEFLAADAPLSPPA